MRALLLRVSIVLFMPLVSDSLSILILSGAEGGPVLSETAQLIGMLIRPLRQKTSGAEVQVTLEHFLFDMVSSFKFF